MNYSLSIFLVRFYKSDKDLLKMSGRKSGEKKGKEVKKRSVREKIEERKPEGKEMIGRREKEEGRKAKGKSDKGRYICLVPGCEERCDTLLVLQGHSVIKHRYMVISVMDGFVETLKLRIARKDEVEKSWFIYRRIKEDPEVWREAWQSGTWNSWGQNTKVDVVWTDEYPSPPPDVERVVAAPGIKVDRSGPRMKLRKGSRLESQKEVGGRKKEKVRGRKFWEQEKGSERRG